MTYGMLLMPHANARYEQAARPLAQAELELLLGTCAQDGQTFFDNNGPAGFLCFRAEGLTPRMQEILSLHSMLYFVAEMRDDGSFYPLFGRPDSYLFSDLPSILKYKGKTNEAFTHLLVNLALCAGKWMHKGGPLTLLDPMCGRGTTLFNAVNRGMNAVGVDVNRADIDEASGFFSRYLKYHRVKHTVRDDSLTILGGKNVSRRRFEFARNAQDYKEKKTLSLSLIRGDAVEAAQAFRDDSFHLICADLPYGVKHAPKEGGRVSGFDVLLTKLFPVLYAKLKRGGSISLSFNTYTINKTALRAMLANNGFFVLTGGPYDALEHWVEQAVMRDAVVAVKE